MLKYGTWLIMIAIIGLGVYRYDQARGEKKSQLLARKIMSWELDGVSQISIQSPEGEIHLTNQDNGWFITSPYLYPANEAQLSAAFGMMNRVLAEEVLKEEKSQFGFEGSEQKVTLIHFEGGLQNYTLGQQKAPGGQLYVKDVEGSKIYAVHSAWAQVFFQSLPLLTWDRAFKKANDILRISKTKDPRGETRHIVLRDHPKENIREFVESLWQVQIKSIVIGKACSFVGDFEFKIEEKPVRGAAKVESQARTFQVNAAKTRICSPELKMEGVIDPQNFANFWSYSIAKSP